MVYNRLSYSQTSRGIQDLLACSGSADKTKQNNTENQNTMPRVIIYSESQETQYLPLNEGTVTIGRKKDNDIQIDDPSVSAYHAKLVSFFKPTYVQDLRSTNGTYVNGARVMEHTLENDDVITIGEHKIVFDKEYNAENRAEPEHTVELSNSALHHILKK